MALCVLMAVAFGGKEERKTLRMHMSVKQFLILDINS